MKIRKYFLKCLIAAFLLNNILPGEETKAIKTLQEDNQTESLYYFNMAKAYEHEKALEKAIESYKLAIKANPNLETAYSNLGLIYAEKGDYKNSIEVFKKYLNFSNNPEEEALIKEFINKMSMLIKK